MRINAVTVTRDLPPTVSAVGPTAGATSQGPTTLARPTIDVPGIDLDYPVVNAPTEEEFDAAVNSNTNQKKKDTGDETAKARELSAKLPSPAVLKPQAPALLSQLDQAGQRATLPALPPVAAKGPQPAATTSATISLPLLGTMPLPSKEALTLASTTAVTATFVAVLGKAALETSLERLKPAARMLKIGVKKMRSGQLTHEEQQLDFAFNLKNKDKRGIGGFFGDIRDYLKKNFFDHLVG